MKDLRALTPAKEEEAIHEVLAGFERMYASKQTYAPALGLGRGARRGLQQD